MLFHQQIESIHTRSDYVGMSVSFVEQIDCIVTTDRARKNSLLAELGDTVPIYRGDSIVSNQSTFLSDIEAQDWSIIQFRIGGRKIGFIKKLFWLLHSLNRPLVIVYNESDMLGSDFNDILARWPKTQLKVLAANTFFGNYPNVQFFPNGLKRCSAIPLLKQAWEQRGKRDINLFVRLCSQSASKYINETDTRFSAYEKLVNRFGDWIYTSERVSRDQYYQILGCSRFVFCPPGHSGAGNTAYECLYMGAVPIFMYYTRYELDDIPQVIIKDVNELTEDFLESQWATISQRDYQCDHIRGSYWQKYLEDCRLHL